MKKKIQDFTLEEIEKEMLRINEPVHRARQIFKWTHQKAVNTFSEMTDIPKALHLKLDKKYIISRPCCVDRVRSKDGTEKFLWKLDDGKCVETVLIKERTRKTVCISTQVGCKFKCPFCASGSKGFTRDLSTGEIVGQVIAVQELCSLKVTNVVFMGMGEPLDNYDKVGARKITISTCGVVPKILKLKDLGIQIELSVSLHAAENRLRNELVPINRRYPLERLIDACIEYREYTGRIVTLEYTLIKGKNDLYKDAVKLAKIARFIRAKVNLISCNSFEAAQYAGSDRVSINRFKQYLEDRKVTATVRKSKGSDIMAACGQLAVTMHKRVY